MHEVESKILHRKSARRAGRQGYRCATRRYVPAVDKIRIVIGGLRDDVGFEPRCEPVGARFQLLALPFKEQPFDLLGPGCRWEVAMPTCSEVWQRPDTSLKTGGRTTIRHGHTHHPWGVASYLCERQPKSASLEPMNGPPPQALPTTPKSKKKICSL